MRGNELMDAITELDDVLLNEAAKAPSPEQILAAKRARRRPLIFRMAAAAAAVLRRAQHQQLGGGDIQVFGADGDDDVFSVPPGGQRQGTACGADSQQRGAEGGNLVCTGTPEDIAACAKSYTGQFLKPLLE